MFSFLDVALIASGIIPTIRALPTITTKGAKFFADGQQFFIKGVAYQGTPSDPLVNTTQCTLDAELMATIGANSIRVYHVDPTANHDGCMSVFEAKGIYVWLDLDTFSTQIEQTNPAWTQPQFNAFALVADVFQQYDNVAGFWIGNEVVNTAAGSAAAPYVKAAAADMKTYIALKNYRDIPVGYSAADIAQLRPQLQNYLACGDDPSQAIDFFGLNSYEWCGQASYETSGYVNLQAMAEGYNIPIFFSETGCIIPSPRTFTDQAAIFGPQMIDTWSGAIIYEWVQEANDYGLVNYPNGIPYSGAPIEIQPDFENLANQWSSINPTGIAEAAYTPSFSPPACPTASGGWLVNGNVPLPTLGSGIVLAQVGSAVPTPAPAASSSTPFSSSSSSYSASASASSSMVTVVASSPQTITGAGTSLGVPVGAVGGLLGVMGLLFW